MKRGGAVPIVVCIDVEPDARLIRDPADWRGFEESFGLFQKLRGKLEERTVRPVRFSWFLRMDPQIEVVYGSCAWVAERYRALFDTLTEHGDELGIHVHSWKWNATEASWTAEYADQHWVETCIRKGADAYESAFSRRCLSFRFGDRWMNEPTLQLLEDLGIRYDLTVEPGQSESPYQQTGEKHNGDLPDYRSAPRVPYRPARRDFLNARGWWRRKIWMLPVSTGFIPAARFGLPESDPPVCLALNLCFTPFAFSSVLQQSLACGWIAPVVRTDVAITSGQRQDCEQNFRILLDLAASTNCRFITPAELIKG